MTTVEWCAGFFEGEGTAFVNRAKYKDRQYPCFRLSLAQVHREPLDAFQEVVGGNVTGPYGPYSTTRQAHYQWNSSGEKAIEIAKKLLPYLYAKGLQVSAALNEIKEVKLDQAA